MIICLMFVLEMIICLMFVLEMIICLMFVLEMIICLMLDNALRFYKWLPYLINSC